MTPRTETIADKFESKEARIEAMLHDMAFSSCAQVAQARVNPKTKCTIGVSGVGIDDPNCDDSAQAPAQAGAQSKYSLTEKLRAKLQIVGADGDGAATVTALEGGMGSSTKALEAIGVLLKGGDAMVNETRLVIEGATAAEAGCGSSPAELRGLRRKVEAFGRYIQVVRAALTNAEAELARQQKLAAAAGKGNGAAVATGDLETGMIIGEIHSQFTELETSASAMLTLVGGLCENVVITSENCRQLTGDSAARLEE
jgi:hypothetical protein